MWITRDNFMSIYQEILSFDKQDYPQFESF